jgi:hypothetical protein
MGSDALPRHPIRASPVVPLMPAWRNFVLGSELVQGVRPFRTLKIDDMRDSVIHEIETTIPTLGRGCPATALGRWRTEGWSAEVDAAPSLS